MKWIGTEDMSDCQKFSIALAGGNLTVEMTSEHSVVMDTGKNTFHFGFRLSPPTETLSLSVAELQELQAFMAYLIDRNLAKHVRLK
jgi:hypothetical protein